MKTVTLLLACTIAAATLGGCQKRIDTKAACAELLQTELDYSAAPRRMEILQSHGVEPAGIEVVEELLTASLQLADLIDGLAQQSEKHRAAGDAAQAERYLAWSQKLNQCYEHVPNCGSALEAALGGATEEDVEAALGPLVRCVGDVAASMRPPD